jgi:hypothetical protein
LFAGDHEVVGIRLSHTATNSATRAQKAADRTNDELEQAASLGMPWHNAWDLVKNRYVFLPSRTARRVNVDATLPRFIDTRFCRGLDSAQSD